jgi:hypothetical protein
MMKVQVVWFSGQMVRDLFAGSDMNVAEAEILAFLKLIFCSIAIVSNQLLYLHFLFQTSSKKRSF